MNNTIFNLTQDIEMITENLVNRLDKDDLVHLLLEIVGSQVVLDSIQTAQVYQESLKNLPQSPLEKEYNFRCPCYQCRDIGEALDDILKAFCIDSTELYNYTLPSIKRGKPTSVQGFKVDTVHKV